EDARARGDRHGCCNGGCRAAEVVAGIPTGAQLHVDVGSVDGRDGRGGHELAVRDGPPGAVAAVHVLESPGQAARREAAALEVEVAAGLVLDREGEAGLARRLLALDVARYRETAEVAVVGVDDVAVAVAVDGCRVDGSAASRDGGSRARPSVRARHREGRAL